MEYSCICPGEPKVLASRLDVLPVVRWCKTHNMLLHTHVFAACLVGHQHDANGVLANVTPGWVMSVAKAHPLHARL